MKFDKVMWVFIVIALFNGCIQTAQPSSYDVAAYLDKPFDLKVNETAFIKQENMSITFVDIIEDSRCPMGAVCVWEGRVIAKVNIVKDSKQWNDVELIMRPGHREFKVIDGYKITLINVEPYPKVKEKIDLSEYVITLVVSQDDKE